MVDDLPADEQSSVVLLTGSYGEAGALDRFGPALGLPPAYSAHNSYADFRQPTDPDATVVAVRYRLDGLLEHFERVRAGRHRRQRPGHRERGAGHADHRVPRPADARGPRPGTTYATSADAT